MPESIHGHAVLRLLLDAPHPLSLPALREAAAERFGADTRFHTCSARDLTLDQLVDFLLARRKLAMEDGALVVRRAEICADA